MQNQNYETQTEVYEKPEAIGHLFNAEDIICTSAEPPWEGGDND